MCKGPGSRLHPGEPPAGQAFRPIGYARRPRPGPPGASSSWDAFRLLHPAPIWCKIQRRRGMKITTRAWALTLSILLLGVPFISLPGPRDQHRGCCASRACCAGKNCPMRTSHSATPQSVPGSSRADAGATLNCSCSVSPEMPEAAATTLPDLVFRLPAGVQIIPPRASSLVYEERNRSSSEAFVSPPDQPPRAC